MLAITLRYYTQDYHGVLLYEIKWIASLATNNEANYTPYTDAV